MSEFHITRCKGEEPNQLTLLYFFDRGCQTMGAECLPDSGAVLRRSPGGRGWISSSLRCVCQQWCVSLTEKHSLQSGICGRDARFGFSANQTSPLTVDLHLHCSLLLLMNWGIYSSSNDKQAKYDSLTSLNQELYIYLHSPLIITPPMQQCLAPRYSLFQ